MLSPYRISQTIPFTRFAIASLSILLFFFGSVNLWLTIWPAIANSIAKPQPYHPQLPLATDREEDSVKLNQIPVKQIFPSRQEIVTVQDGNWLRLPSIGVAVPLASSPSMRDDDVAATLKQGAALYPNGILPGHPGNVFISAHSTGEPWKGTYRFAFLRINELAQGNMIHLDFNHVRYTYRVTNKNIIKPNQDYRLQSRSLIPHITLMACWPIWSTSQRMLVQAQLTNITKLTPSPS